MNKRLCGMLWVALLAALLLGSALPVYAAPSARPAGYRLDNAIIDLVVQPGKTYTHRMVLSNPADGPEADVAVYVGGFGQVLDGKYVLLTESEDKSPYSGVSCVQGISTPNFHLKPGGSQEVVVTLSIPEDFGPYTRYALIYIHCVPRGGSGVAFASAFNVPVILAPANVQPQYAGQITELVAKPVESGKPIEVVATVKNTSNPHFRAVVTVDLLDAAGTLVTRQSVRGGSSIFPTYARQYTVPLSMMDRVQGLQPGRYTVECKATLEDGTLLDSKKTDVTITAPWVPFPGIPEQNLLIKHLVDEEPGCIDARTQADTELCFEGTGKVTGAVAIGKYSVEPAGEPTFAEAAQAAGEERTAVKFVGLRIQGFGERGRASVTVYYQPDELRGVSPNNLFLAFRSQDGWTKLERQSLLAGVGAVRGEIPAYELVRGPVVALAAAESPPTASPWYAGLMGMPALVAAGVGLVLIVLVIVLVMRRKDKGRA
ncbi:MAG: hypothetical protein ACUVX9_12070 [Anaerolineae bacterium]